MFCKTRTGQSGRARGVGLAAADSANKTKPVPNVFVQIVQRSIKNRKANLKKRLENVLLEKKVHVNTFMFSLFRVWDHGLSLGPR